MNLWIRALAATIALAAATPAWAQLVVVTARGPQFKVGQRLDAGRPVALKAGEQITLVGADGRSVTLKGPYNGPPLVRTASNGGGSAQALTALLAQRQARATAVGVVRSGVEAPKLPDPWLIDISRSGARCLKPGTPPVWWRPDAARAATFTVFPIDRSWRADFTWAAGQDRMAVPPLAKFDGVTSLIFRADGEERMVTVARAPEAVDSDLMLAGWLIEKDCGQQADALLRALERTPDAR